MYIFTIYIYIEVLPDLLVLSESWLDEGKSQLANTESYDCYFSIHSRSDGVSVYCKNTSVTYFIAPFTVNNKFVESCCVKIDVAGVDTSVIGINRPHSGTIEEFIGELDKLLQECNFFCNF